MEANAQAQAQTQLNQAEGKQKLLDALDRRDKEALKALFPKLDVAIRERFFDEIDQQFDQAKKRKLNPGSKSWMHSGREAITDFATPQQWIHAIDVVFPSAVQAGFVPVQVESIAEQMEQDLLAIQMSTDLVESSTPSAVTAGSSSSKGKEEASDIEGDFDEKAMNEWVNENLDEQNPANWSADETEIDPELQARMASEDIDYDF